MIDVYTDNLVVSLSLLIMLLFYLFKPKKINSWYGYRSQNSMKNQLSWDFAQKYASKYSTLLLLILLVLQYPIYNIIKDNSISGLVITLLWLVNMISMIATVEYKLKKMNKN